MSSRGTGMPAIAVPVRLSDGDVGDADPRVGGANKIFADVVDLVRAAGAEPVLVGSGTEEETERLLDGCQGFLVPGGGDVDPALYGGAVDHPALYDVNREQDRLDLAVIRHARRTGRPYLGICRGMQLLNVEYGGSLHVDLARTSVLHDPTGVTRDEWALHDVEVAPDSRVAAAYAGATGAAGAAEVVAAGGTLPIASGHHQAVDRAGAGLRVTARAADGCVEAVESLPGTPWTVGVQWHPEAEVPSDALRLPLFAALCREARAVREVREVREAARG
ncbi:gamma-glutamyl-gamma-aminobutyrate hydrolase family protein [Streptacidiphilus albus]|uniref:gamma-glutamyl-gamma-aminobutyrate hydrolase family protein n=1 Tax=Streptacidiphilus albus TaxID=105425 RepID=UPI0005A9DAB1|nr:type 1 glutamine amidotransferase [Streptacidiphilus albus]